MRILFITRKYPPSTGGMENAAYELYTALVATNDVTLVQFGGKNKYLPVVYFKLLFQALWHGLRHKPDAVYLQDGIMAPLGWIVKLVLHRPTVMTIHGLEATYQNPVYKVVVTPFIKRQTRLVAVSEQTKLMVEKGLPGVHPEVILNGVRDAFYQPKDRAEQLAFIARETGITLEQLKASQLLHTNGRLVRRKGVLWFVNEVMPQLVASQPVLYLVSGKGKDQEVIETAIRKQGLENSVKLLGRISDELLKTLYNTVDAFVMPNIPVPNDMEGFGLVALEAASCGRTVIVSRLEGIQDAIIDGKNGLLVQPLDATAWVKTLQRELTHPTLRPADVRQFTIETFSWDAVAKAYETTMSEVRARQ
jgi:glycosyltransferase involved in cell wall biosynthesis